MSQLNSAPLLCHWHDYWGYGCHFSLCDSSRAIIVNTYSSPLHHTLSVVSAPRHTRVIYPCPPPLSLCLLGDVKMILRPGKRFMFRTQISLGKLSLPGQFSCLAKHLKGSIRKKKIIPSSVLNVHDSELALSICAMLPPRLQVINWQQKVMRNEI